MKFAYLIMAHDNPDQLIRLLKQLDWSMNDIYLHLDKRSTCFDFGVIGSAVVNANLFIYSKYRVYWGDISQTKCQIYLLKQAVSTYHDYYHLLSGKDFPLKSHEEIRCFFEANIGKNFVHFETLIPTNKHNCAHYFWFHSILNRVNHSITKKTLRTLQNISISVQDKLQIKPELYAGANWFSITHELASDFLRDRRKVLREVRFVQCSDEFVLQTYIMKLSKKPYIFYKIAENDYTSIVRAIDWNRGNPYVWRASDYDELVESGCMFARKIDTSVDSRLIDYLEIHNKSGV